MFLSKLFLFCMLYYKKYRILVVSCYEFAVSYVIIKKAFVFRSDGMVQSMTGFGRGEKINEKTHITVEMKTVNHRFLDLNLRLPRSLQSLEEPINKKISQFLNRGRVEFFLSLEGFTEKNLKVDWHLFSQYMRLYEEAKLYTMGQAVEDMIHIKDILSMPEVIAIETKDTKNEQLELVILETVDEALHNLYEMRKREGERLKADLLTQLAHMEALHQLLVNHSDELTPRLREKYMKRLSDVLDGQYDEQRVYTEIAVLSERADIHEEISRLAGHMHQFQHELSQNGAIGRKLDFIVQEMNREVNTIGSKANALEVTKIVIELKSFIEKIREQVQNVE